MCEDGSIVQARVDSYYYAYSGGSRISSRRGRQLPGGAPTYDFAKISQKLHEIERIWTPGGARVQNFTMYIRHWLIIRKEGVLFHIS